MIVDREIGQMGDGTFLTYLPGGRWEMAKIYFISQSQDGRWKNFTLQIFYSALDAFQLSESEGTVAEDDESDNDADDVDADVDLSTDADIDEGDNIDNRFLIA